MALIGSCAVRSNHRDIAQALLERSDVQPCNDGLFPGFRRLSKSVRALPVPALELLKRTETGNEMDMSDYAGSTFLEYSTMRAPRQEVIAQWPGTSSTDRTDF